MPIYSSSKLKNCLNDDPFISCSDWTGKKCCITSAYLQWLSHSGERAVARGPLVLCFTRRKGVNLACGQIETVAFFSITRTHYILTLHNSSKLSYVHYYIFTWYTYISDILTLNMLSKKFSQRHSDFSQKIGFDISCKLSPVDSLHELSKPIFWGKI